MSGAADILQRPATPVAIDATDADRALDAAGPVPSATQPAQHAAGAVTPSDLAELMASFNEVTQRLEATHAVLRGEVSRLTAELGEANARLRRSERLAELGQMAAGIAHEIRNPLGSISLYSEMLADDLVSLEAEGPAQTARKIGSSVRRLDAIVRDVLDFARDLVVRPETIDTDDLLEAALGSPRFEVPIEGDPDAHALEAAASAIDARVRIEPGAERVRCDRSLGLQALLNIVENARQATAMTARKRAHTQSNANPTAPAIEVFARPCEVRTGPDEAVEGVAIGVRDLGPGIDAGVLERMFNPFFTTRETGTGLGLAIVHRIVDAHGGSVVVRNNTASGEPDGRSGATVELRFPARAVGTKNAAGIKDGARSAEARAIGPGADGSVGALATERQA